MIRNNIKSTHETSELVFHKETKDTIIVTKCTYITYNEGLFDEYEDYIESNIEYTKAKIIDVYNEIIKERLVVSFNYAIELLEDSLKHEPSYWAARDYVETIDNCQKGDYIDLEHHKIKPIDNDYWLSIIETITNK